MNPETVVVPARFNGPPDSANGGYACGLFAGLAAGEFAGDAETTLRAPPPLDRPLTVERSGAGVSVLDGETLIAQVTPTEITLDVPEPPALDDAQAATAGWPDVDEHMFPTCFTCGPARSEGDGLRIFPGPTADRRLHASPWIPHTSLAEADGLVGDPVMWAALDCPGMAAGMGEDTPALLGRMAARVVRRATPGETYIAYAWPLGREGRKLFSASAVTDLDGAALGTARLTSITLA